MTNDVKEQIIPRHVGIIMDGNGRWAQARGLPRIAGHQAGVKAARRAVETCVEIGVPNLTLFTFSTENWDGLPSTLLETLDEAAQLTKDNRRLSLYLALNYGGRAEIIDAVRKVLTSHRNGTINGVDLDEDDFARYLYAPDLPDADIIIRTGGEHRLSNFLIWRAVGAVFWSTPVLWPDFQSENLFEGINAYVEQFTSSK
jgi:undecaprenyl diphosphate synthase